MGRPKRGEKGANRKTYNAWYFMKQRCVNTHRWDYKHYGGRGITYPSEWETYAGFVADMGESPEGGSLDRIDNNKGYSKENCQWSTASEQAINRRSIRPAEHPGVYLHKKHSKWKAVIKREGVIYTLGTFATKEEAVAARKAAEDSYV